MVRRCFEAYATRQRGVMEEMLAADFRFTSPYDDALDRETYFARCWPANDIMREVAVETVCETGDLAFVRYRVATNDGREFRNTEFMTFDGDRIRHVDVYFGPSYKDGVFVKEKAG